MIETIHLQLLLATFAGWAGSKQTAIIVYLVEENRDLIVRMAEENPSWGYARTQGALRHLDHRVDRSTIAKVLKEYGIHSSPSSYPIIQTYRDHITYDTLAGLRHERGGINRVFWCPSG